MKIRRNEIKEKTDLQRLQDLCCFLCSGDRLVLHVLHAGFDVIKKVGCECSSALGLFLCLFEKNIPGVGCEARCVPAIDESGAERQTHVVMGSSEWL